MSSTVSPVDLALPATRALLLASGAPFRIVGGIAVVHHGYARTTDDIDVLAHASLVAALPSHVAAHGFVVESRSRLRHAKSGVRVDLLFAGEPLPRTGAGVYPAPEACATSPTDPTVIGLDALLDLKVRAHRHRDLADVVELLKRVDEPRYLELEAAMRPDLRPELAELRRDALEELGYERA